jgi:Family of unknown function (DUF5995)
MGTPFTVGRVGDGSIDDVIARLEAIEDELRGRYSPHTPDLAPADGVACFNGLYLQVTKAVRERVREARFFDNRAFVARLDVVFADFYFDAFDTAARGGRVPDAWRPLFNRRHLVRQIHPLQFALAGMNAHINNDLAFSIVETYAEDGSRGPEDASAEHADYLKINAILEEVERAVADDFSAGIVGLADVALGRIDDVFVMWNIANARRTAWDLSQVLWSVRDDAHLTRGIAGLVGDLVGFAGYGLTW